MTAKFRWAIQASLDFLGLPGVASLGLLAFCLVAYLSALLPAQQRLTETLAQASNLRTQMAKSRATQMATPAPEVQLSSFYQSFPAHAATPDLLEKLYAAAADSGIALEQGDYRLISRRGDKLARYQITLPVKGTYPQIRKFISHLLADLPAASLDGVSFLRQKIGDTQVESQLKLTLYLGDA